MSRSVTLDYESLRKPKRQGYCWPSLGEPCGDCHRCGNPAAAEQELADDYERNDHQ